KQGKSTDAKDLLNDSCLVKWENKNNLEVLNKARKLIWIAYNADSYSDVHKSLDDFNTAFSAIKEAEQSLYSILDRHIDSKVTVDRRTNLHRRIEEFLTKMP